METHELSPLEYHTIELDPVWETSDFDQFEYKRNEYGDMEQLAKWKTAGHTHNNFTGMMFNDQLAIPQWAKDIGKILDWKDCGFTFYKMTTGDILPPHADHYNKYKELFGIESSDDVLRCLVFLEDKKQGHIFEIDQYSMNWHKGGAVLWRGRVPHSAGNIGYESRYTLQITGHY
jgi:hypothetical protein|tara:strand:- start:1181 stop:1705 length:525 start_codon:yes stop_codon:yes gene_type:complete